ncbi:MAG: serine dehydratase subunit alpha family protein [Lachnospiraceae bacterium]|nr:serine dehydratase subunit alpha family protein [Lachnospiraceae bacterium]
MNKELLYNKYIDILKEELIPAMGCTEPIAIAYCASIARKHLSKMPTKVSVFASGNIIKNVKSVIVPNTNGLKGIPAAAFAGIIAGDSNRMLEVISSVNDTQKKEMADALSTIPCDVKLLEDGSIFDILIELQAGDDYSIARITDYHTNVVYIEKNGTVILDKRSEIHSPASPITDSAVIPDACSVSPNNSDDNNELSDRSILNVEAIIDFADNVELTRVEAILSQQIEYNMAIAEAGLNGNFGANVGRVLLNSYGNDIKIRARAKAAAASDARMNGCELPVVINSGSGNQGITASVPVIEYARELEVSEEKLYRALLVSNLITIHLKTGIGRLSAYCGAVSAGCGAGAGIAYLHGGDFKTIAHTVVNSLAIVSGIVCDGAKASCAGKIAAAVDAGILGYHMYENGNQFRGGDGIVTKGVENTIRNIGHLGREGMKETDKEILKIMLEQ